MFVLNILRVTYFLTSSAAVFKAVIVVNVIKYYAHIIFDTNQKYYSV